MNHYLIIYRSVTHAQLAAKRLSRAGIVNQLQRTPAGLTERGCSYALRVPERMATAAIEELRDFSPRYYRIFAQAGGEYREVGTS